MAGNTPATTGTLNPYQLSTTLPSTPLLLLSILSFQPKSPLFTRQMIPPVSPTSVLDQAHTEASQICSSGGEINHTNNRNHQSDTPHIHYPRLDEIYKLARQDAEIQHAQKKEMQKQKPRKAVIRKPKTNRQASNIRSAEICREASKIYSTRLEEAILQEEDAFLQLTADTLDLIAEDIKLEQRIRELEEKKRKMEHARLWMNNKSCEGSREVDSMMSYGVFPESNIGDEMIQWPFGNQTMSYVSDFEEDVEMLISDGEVVMTPPSHIENPAAMTPEEKKMLSVEGAFVKDVRLPVSAFNVVRQVDDEESLRPKAGV